MDAIDKLRNSLKEKNPALFLGAGFSRGAKNHEGKSVPLARELTEMLYENMFKVNPKKVEIADDDLVAAEEYAKNSDLKKLCNLLRLDERLVERNEFLTNVFKGLKINSDSSHFYISNYKWDRIFTLNIDDLVENIYKYNSVPLKVWNKDTDDMNNPLNHTTLIKLHGCVRNPDKGYVFDDKEYTGFANKENYLLKEFGHTFVRNDIIFLGTEFQESDLNSIIDKYERSGYDSAANNYFLIVPQIREFNLKKQIQKSDNFHHIEWDSEKFFEFLHEEINYERTAKKALKEKGLISLDDLFKNRDVNHESKIYTGTESVYDDFFNDWDIIRPEIKGFENQILAKKENVVAAVVGKSYTGKTCVVKRLLLDLRAQGYITFQFKMRSTEYINLFKDYLDQLENGSKVAVLFEEASFYYPLLYNNLLSEALPNIGHLVILTSDTCENHDLKADILAANNCLLELSVSEEIKRGFAENIYNKLNEKHWLGKLRGYGDNKNDIIKYVCNVNDVIDVLYTASHGKGFEEHFADIFGLVSNSTDIKYIQALSVMEQLGVSGVPKEIFPSLLKQEEFNFDFKRFNSSFGEIILIEDNRIKLRCLRLIQHAIDFHSNKLPIKDILVDIVRETSGRFNEGDTNESCEIFQKSLSVKRLIKKDIMSYEDINQLLNEVRPYSAQYSYYWIQRGIIAQKCKDFDLADNYFREAIKINSKSYQARHALAKNLMERAIEQYEKGNTSTSPHYLSEGKNEMKKIIDNDAFSRGFRYSVHTYIDMLMKYHNLTKIRLSYEEADYIQDKIICILEKENDKYMNTAIQGFVDYCCSNDMGRYCNKILNWRRHGAKYSSIIKEEDYYVENLDVVSY